MLLNEFDPITFQQDAEGILSARDITIVAVLLGAAKQSVQDPYLATAEQLNLTPGRVRHRTFKTAAFLQHGGQPLAKYYPCLQEVFSRPQAFVVSLPS